MIAFRWTEKAEKAAFALAEGKTRAEVAIIAEVGENTIYRWLRIPEFSQEVDRLTFLTGIAVKAERLRRAKRVIEILDINTEKDLLDWLKYVASETDGIKLDFAELLDAFNAHVGSVADK